LGGVFISYRRDDAPSAAWLIRNHLTQALGAETIFLDSASLQPGDEWEPALDQSVRSCVALLAIVGRAWVSPRLHEPRDFVRFEIQTALDRGVRVIPVLVDAAAMPEPEKLPDGLKVLPGRQWIKILSDDPTSGLRELSAIVGRTLRGLDKPEETVRRPAGDPKLGKEEITDLSIFVSSLIRNPNNFDNLVVSAFGEDLYNIYVPDRATGKVIPA